MKSYFFSGSTTKALIPPPLLVDRPLKKEQFYGSRSGSLTNQFPIILSSGNEPLSEHITYPDT